MDGLMMLGGALSGGAKAADELATGQINDAREVSRAKILSDIQLERSKAMEDYREQASIRADERSWENEQTRALEKNRLAGEKRKAELQTEQDFKTDPANIKKELAALRAKLPEEAAIKGEAEVKTLLAKKIAAATRDPNQQKLLNLQIQKAEAELGDAKGQAKDRERVRGLMEAERSVDTTQPGAEESKKFYDEETKKEVERQRAAKGGLDVKGAVKIVTDAEGKQYGVVTDKHGNIYKIDPESLPTYNAKPTKDGKTDKFEVGKIYRDGTGKRAKYLGDGQWKAM